MDSVKTNINTTVKLVYIIKLDFRGCTYGGDLWRLVVTCRGM